MTDVAVLNDKITELSERLNRSEERIKRLDIDATHAEYAEIVRNGEPLYSHRNFFYVKFGWRPSEFFRNLVKLGVVKVKYKYEYSTYYDVGPYGEKYLFLNGQTICVRPGMIKELGNGVSALLDIQGG